jgi:lipoic acid synthetase
MSLPDYQPASRLTPESHQRGADKLARLPVKVELPVGTTRLAKPSWIRIKLSADPKIAELKRLLRQQGLHTVCEEAACPNLAECFSSGTATFMILGDQCTRRCPFCDVAHGKPTAPDPAEPQHLAETVKALKLRYVVVTSVNRDDLRDGGAAHFAACIAAIRLSNPTITIECLTPDFRGRIPAALAQLAAHMPDVFNHNLETVPRLYRSVRPGADYQVSLTLLAQVKQQHPQLRTKSGLMLGLGEQTEELVAVMQDLRAVGCDMLTLGQYLPPSTAHLPVLRYVPPEEFSELGQIAKRLGFTQVASAPLVRSSYHAEQQSSQR